MKKVSYDIRTVADMNLSTRAVADRLKSSPKTVNRECMKVYGMTWAELKAAQRAAKNARLNPTPVGKTSYFGTKPGLLKTINHSRT